MYILDNACGLIPNAPIQFMYHLINLIKNLTPVVLIIMGSLDFGKAVMSQKDDEIKKAQGAFIKKLIAGAAVFFVIVFVKWIVQILQNAGVTDSNKAFACVSAILNNSYQADDTPYYEGPDIKSTTTTTKTTKKTTTIDYSTDSCWAQVQKIPDYEGFSSLASCKSIMKSKGRNDMEADLFCKDLCQKNPYVTTTTPITEMPDIDVIEPTGPSFLPDINESIDGVILSEEIQGKYENSSCWNNIEKYAGFSACWSSVYYNTKLTIPSYTESQAKQVCMKLCNENQ